MFEEHNILALIRSDTMLFAVYVVAMDAHWSLNATVLIMFRRRGYRISPNNG